jgi:hypothetical protein
MKQSRMGYGLVWGWERSDHCTEWIQRGNGARDRVDAGQPMELVARALDKGMQGKIFPPFPPFDMISSLQLKGGGLCKGSYTYFSYSLATSHMYGHHVMILIFYPKPHSSIAFPALLEAPIEARALVLSCLAHTLGTRRLLQPKTCSALWNIQSSKEATTWERGIFQLLVVS